MHPPSDADTWLALADDPLPVASAADWVVLPHCGAVSLFVGTVRDHADDRAGVTELVYEAYEELAVPRLAAVADELRARWPSVGRVALLHRTGTLSLGDPAVVVATSTPHRAEAIAATHFAIDAVKATVPIWKKETWADGAAWGADAQHVVDVVAFAEARS